MSEEVVYNIAEFFSHSSCTVPVKDVKKLIQDPKSTTYISGIVAIDTVMPNLKNEEEMCDMRGFEKGSEDAIGRKINMKKGTDYLVPALKELSQFILNDMKTHDSFTGYEFSCDDFVLSIYQSGVGFTKHQDAWKSNTHVGNVIILFPSKFTGGDLIIEGEKPFAAECDRVQYVFFHPSRSHEMTPIISGHAIIVGFSVFANIEWGYYPHIEDGYAMAILRDLYFTKTTDSDFGVVLRTCYAPTQNLDGEDMNVYNTLVNYGYMVKRIGIRVDSMSSMVEDISISAKTVYEDHKIDNIELSPKVFYFGDNPSTCINSEIVDKYGGEPRVYTSSFVTTAILAHPTEKTYWLIDAYIKGN